MIKQGEIVDHARSAPIKRYAIDICWLVQEELDIDISERGAQQRQLMQEPAFVLSRLYRILLACHLVDDIDPHSGRADTIAQFRRQIPLDLLSRQRTNSVEQRRDRDFRAAVAE